MQRIRYFVSNCSLSFWLCSWLCVELCPKHLERYWDTSNHKDRSDLLALGSLHLFLYLVDEILLSEQHMWTEFACGLLNWGKWILVPSVTVKKAWSWARGLCVESTYTAYEPWVLGALFRLLGPCLWRGMFWVAPERVCNGATSNFPSLPWSFLPTANWDGFLGKVLFAIIWPHWNLF
jgi:hypothetical protein